MFSKLKILELNYIVKFMYVECRSIFRVIIIINISDNRSSFIKNFIKLKLSFENIHLEEEEEKKRKKVNVIRFNQSKLFDVNRLTIHP